MTNELFKPALIAEQLKEIRIRNPGNQDVITLLWEIKRLRALALRADPPQASLGQLGGVTGIILQGLRKDLDDEPVVIEDRKSRQGILNPYKDNRNE